MTASFKSILLLLIMLHGFDAKIAPIRGTTIHVNLAELNSVRTCYAVIIVIETEKSLDLIIVHNCPILIIIHPDFIAVAIVREAQERKAELEKSGKKAEG